MIGTVLVVFTLSSSTEPAHKAHKSRLFTAGGGPATILGGEHLHQRVGQLAVVL